MVHIDQELDRVYRALHADDRPGRYEELYAIQQALEWVLNPTAFKAPYEMVTGTRGEKVDCLSSKSPQ